jgi:hypothetical protein
MTPDQPPEANPAVTLVVCSRPPVRGAAERRCFGELIRTVL